MLTYISLPQQRFNYVNLHICPSKGLTMLTYISLSQQRFKLKLKISLKNANTEQNVFSWHVNGHVSFNLVGVYITLLSPYSINNDRHSLVSMTGWRLQFTRYVYGIRPYSSVDQWTWGLLGSAYSSLHPASELLPCNNQCVRYLHVGGGHGNLVGNIKKT